MNRRPNVLATALWLSLAFWCVVLGIYDLILGLLP